MRATKTIFLFGLFSFALLSPALGFSESSAPIPQVKSVQINGADIEYQISGRGPTIVLVHGAISDRRAWAPVSTLLADDFQVYAYTQRYFGNGEWLDDGSGFQRENHINDLISFVESLASGPVHLVTRSYGGYVGAHATYRRPDLFESAVHFEPAITDHIQHLPGFENAWKEFLEQMSPVTAALKQGDSGSAALRFLEVVYRMPLNSADSSLQKTTLSMIRQNGRTVNPFFKMKSVEPLTCDNLKKIDVPHLIVVGENTHVWFAMAAEQMDRCLVSSENITMERVNHDGIMRRPETFAKLVRDFISTQ